MDCSYSIDPHVPYQVTAESLKLLGLHINYSDYFPKSYLQTSYKNCHVHMYRFPKQMDGANSGTKGGAKCRFVFTETISFVFKWLWTLMYSFALKVLVNQILDTQNHNIEETTIELFMVAYWMTYIFIKRK